jgi:hypothetical protein
MMQPKDYRGIGLLGAVGAACALFLFCAVSLGQEAMPPETLPNNDAHMGPGAHRHFRQPSTVPAAGPAQSSPAPVSPAPMMPAAAPFAPAKAPSLLDKPAEPAKIDLSAGHLSIQAQNSSLTEILHQVTAASGMTVEGLATDQRVFGSYGPGDPEDVLMALLHGFDYNVVMLGRTESGAPKDLTLSPRGAPMAYSGSNRQAQTQEEDNDDDQQSQPVQDTPPPPAPATPNPGPPNGVRTPQQMLQEMQQLRQQQQQQQPQQQP